MSSRTKTLAGIALLALAASGCGGATDTAESGTTQAPTAAGESASASGTASVEGATIRIGSSSSTDFTDMTLLRLVDELEEDGATVEVSNFEGDQAAIRALVAGEIDIAAAAIPALINLAAQSDEGARVFAVNLQETDYLLVGQPDISDLEGLAGRQVGIASPGGNSDVLTRKVLTDEGIDLDEVDFVSVGGTSARMSALASNQVAAGAAHAADAFAAIEEFDMSNLWTYADTIDNYLQQGLIANDSWLDENAAVAQVVTDEMILASRWAAENKDEYIEMSLDEVEGISDSAREQAYDVFVDIGMFPVNGGMDAGQLTSTGEIEVELGNLSELPPLEVWSDPTFVEDFLEREGEM